MEALRRVRAEIAARRKKDPQREFSCENEPTSMSEVSIERSLSPQRAKS
jgi:hypothetical protein